MREGYVYSHGGNATYESGNESILDLSANINPLGMPDGVKSAIIRDIQNCGRYPDSFSGKLREKIALFENVTPDWVFCSNGASDIIFRLPRAVQAKKIMIAAPTFSDYERSASSYGSKIIRYQLFEADGFSLDDDFVESVKNAKPDLVYVCNPNNPTGRLMESYLIGKLLDCCLEMGAWVAVDECFLDFSEKACDYTSKVFFGNHPNLIVIKAFTKLFAMPGIRLGYALCADEALMGRLYLHGAEWSVSNLAQVAGMAALEGAGDYIRQTVQYVSAERTVMEKTLAHLGYKVFKSAANYTFIKSPYPSDLREGLDAKGIRIRSCGNYHGLDNRYYRTAVSTRKNNEMFLAAVKEITN